MKTSTPYRWLAASIFTLPQVQHPPKPPQVHFLCPSRPFTWIYRLPQRDNGRSPQISSHPWSSSLKNSAPTTNPRRQGQLPSSLCSIACNKSLWIHPPAPHKNPLCLGSVSTRIIRCTQASPGFCTITLSTRFHSRLHPLCFGLRKFHCWSPSPRRWCSPWARDLLH